MAGRGNTCRSTSPPTQGREGAPGSGVGARVPPAVGAEARGLEGKPRLATAEEILARTGYPMGGTPSFSFDALFVMDEHAFEKPVVYTGGGSPRPLACANPYELLRANR